MKLLSKIAVAGVGALLLASLAQPVMAGCTNNYLVTSSSAEGSTFIFNEGTFNAYNPADPLYGGYAPGLSPQAEAFWWQLGLGDPAIGAGLDNGSWGIENWVPPYPVPGYTGVFWFPSLIQGGWGQDPAAIDGCISDDGNVLGECMCVLVTDEFDGSGLGLLFGAATDANGFARLNLPGGNVALPLLDVPGPTIVGSSRDAVSNDVTVSVGAAIAAGFDNSKDGCACIGSMQFKVYSNTVMRGAAAPVSRDDGWVERSGPTPISASADVLVDCGASDTDVYLSTSIVTDSGFETELSANSTRVECGPNIATPDDLQELRPGRQTPRGARQGRTR